jgi:hypothetical protein
MATEINGKTYANSSPIAVLRSAKQLLTDVGWAQGHYEDFEVGLDDEVHSVGFCALGAIRKIAGPHWWKAMRRLEELVGEIPAYNDAKGRTRAQILRLFSRAIKGGKGAT